VLTARRLSQTLGVIEANMASALVIAGGSIFVLMGLVHGLVSLADVFRPSQFAPADDSVRVAMKSTTVRFLKARANVWDAWLGFNISHGLGMLIFGTAAVYLGASLEHMAVAQSALLIPATIAATYFLLSMRFWFWLPATSSAVAVICFMAAWWSA